ncbi:hypothetical protein MUK42_30257 [Musa troglodytarum]|uniref:Uncharacterized protein n=1 Tax=Musa troglodytarum TaxID=320322 RepID=A0A9E7FP46_9LILI|nr:hypothetical protein MUK42_30257 [Musa troglodytarum]
MATSSTPSSPVCPPSTSSPPPASPRRGAPPFSPPSATPPVAPRRLRSPLPRVAVHPRPAAVQLSGGAPLPRAAGLHLRLLPARRHTPLRPLPIRVGPRHRSLRHRVARVGGAALLADGPGGGPRGAPRRGGGRHERVRGRRELRRRARRLRWRVGGLRADAGGLRVVGRVLSGGEREEAVRDGQVVSLHRELVRPGGQAVGADAPGAHPGPDRAPRGHWVRERAPTAGGGGRERDGGGMEGRERAAVGGG